VSGTESNQFQIAFKTLDAIPPEKRPNYILQQRMNFEPAIQTPHVITKAEVSVMYIWLEDLKPVLTIIRMGRGLMMGVDQNKNMEWVGASAELYLEAGQWPCYF